MILEQLNKYKIHAVVIIFLIIIFFYFKKEKLSARKKRGAEPEKAPTRKKNNKSKKQQRKAKEPENKGFLSKMFGSEKQDDNDKAEELYNLVHDDMLEMTMEEFEDIAGDYGENDLFIELKQLYNDCEKKNKNIDDITVEDYEVILEKLQDD